MKMIKILAVTAAVCVGAAVTGTVSYAAPGTYFTHVDNASNANVPGSNTNTLPDNDMATGSLLTEPAPAITFSRISPAAPIEFNIDVTASPVNSASLTIRAYDVDEESGEQDDVYLNGHLLGRLTGANDVWSTTVFNIANLSWLVANNNLVEIQLDTSGDPTNWVAAVRWGQILADGGAADRANTGSVIITGCVTNTATVAGCAVSDTVPAGTVRIDAQAMINVVTAGNYRLEVTIIDPAGNSSSVLTDSFSATAGITTRTISPTYALNSDTGPYIVQSQLYYIDSNNFPVQQDIATATFQHAANAGPTDLDNEGLTHAEEIALGTDPMNPDTDGDGILDGTEVGADANNPVDTDGDGIIDALESGVTDTDGDGMVNSADTDSDNDGIPDAVERGPGLNPVDTDGDGIPDYLDRDSDNDTLPDTLEAGPDPSSPVDTDNDGRPDYLDLDSDNDGIPDRLEGGGLGLDSDNDGIDDAFDVTNQGGVDANLDGVADDLGPHDTDQDGVADFRSIDSDGDGILDTVEANLTGLDSDGDGIDDAIDTDITLGADLNGDLIDDAYVLPDSDGDGIPDYRDPPGRLETAQRGIGAFDGWMLLLLLPLLWRRRAHAHSGIPAMLAAAVLIAPGVPSALAKTADDHRGEWYLGGDLGWSWLEPSGVNSGYLVDDTTSHGYRLLVGHQVWRNFSLEGFYVSAGEAGISSDNPVVGHLGELEYDLYGAGTEWTPLAGGRARTLYPVLKSGLIATNNSATSPAINYDKVHSLSLYLGAAGVWQFAESWRAQLELTSYDDDELMLTVGLRKTFGGNRQPAVAVAAAPEPAPALAAEPVPVEPPPPPEPDPIPAEVAAVAPADGDLDGVSDVNDQCPSTPAGDTVDSSGCSLTVRLELNFENNSSQLKPESYADLDLLVAFLRAVPAATGEIQGHTDDVGSARYNLRLSGKRAESVRAYLVDKGIDPARLQVKGYGETQPVGNNETAEGRAENRRVLFVRTDVR